MVTLGVHEPPENDLERFLSMIRFDAREKLEELPDFQLNNIWFFYKKRSSRNSKNPYLYYLTLADAQWFGVL